MEKWISFIGLCAVLHFGGTGSSALAGDQLNIQRDPQPAGPQCIIPSPYDISDWELLALDLQSSQDALTSLARTRPEHMMLLLYLASINGKAIPVDSRYIKVGAPITDDEDQALAIDLLGEVFDMLSRDEGKLQRDDIMMHAQLAFPVEEYEWQSVCAQGHDLGKPDARLVIATGVQACNSMGLSFPELRDDLDADAITELSLKRISNMEATVEFPDGTEILGGDSAPIYAIAELSRIP